MGLNLIFAFCMSLLLSRFCQLIRLSDQHGIVR